MSDIIFEPTNELRRCFGLMPIRKSWVRTEIKQKTYDPCRTFVYLNGKRIERVIQVSDEPGFATYREFSLDRSVSEDGKYLIQSNGKPRRLTVYELERASPVGMALDFRAPYVYVCNATANADYYSSVHEGFELNDLDLFKRWVNAWCEDSGDRDIREIKRFSKLMPGAHEYREGDFFRFRLDRHTYGYGRIVLDVRNILDSGKPCWHFFKSEHLYAAVYCVMTDNKHLRPEDLAGKMMLPPRFMVNTRFVSGEYEIIGNLPITEDVDFPVHYEEFWDTSEYRHTVYQRGRDFRTVEYEDPVEECFGNRHARDSVSVTVPMLKRCICDSSIAPYWETWNRGELSTDLRNPELADTLDRILKHVGAVYDEKTARMRLENPAPNRTAKKIKINYKRNVY